MANAMTTETRVKAASRETLAEWQGLAFLTREPDRNGNAVYVIRVKAGSFIPFRYGPFGQEQEAREMFKTICELLESDIFDTLQNIGAQVGCNVNEEF